MLTKFAPLAQKIKIKGDKHHLQVLKNVKAYVDGEIVKCDITFENGIIKEIGKNLDTYKAKEISVDKYSVVCPGFIDEHIHGAAGADGWGIGFGFGG